jgi:hypothetical protein
MFMKHRAGLHNEKDAEDIRASADGLLRLAGTADNTGGSRSATGQHQPLRLMDAGRIDDEAGDMETDDHDAANA